MNFSPIFQFNEFLSIQGKIFVFIDYYGQISTKLNKADYITRVVQPGCKHTCILQHYPRRSKYWCSKPPYLILFYLCRLKPALLCHVILNYWALFIVHSSFRLLLKLLKRVSMDPVHNRRSMDPVQNGVSTNPSSMFRPHPEGSFVRKF